MVETINELQREIHANAKAKGFWESGDQFAERMMLVVTEIAEAVDADRENKQVDPRDMEYFLTLKEWTAEDNTMFEKAIKDTIPDELADATIRIMDVCESRGYNLYAHIRAKMNYNSTRARLHGKKY